MVSHHSGYKNNRGLTEEQQADQFDSASEGEDDLLEALTNNVKSLGEGSLFLSVVLRNSADQSRLIQDSSHNYVVISCYI